MDAQTQQAAAPLEGQTILLTGATDGLGAHLARQVAASGARLLCTAAIPRGRRRRGSRPGSRQ